MNMTTFTGETLEFYNNCIIEMAEMRKIGMRVPKKTEKALIAELEDFDFSMNTTEMVDMCISLAEFY